MIKKTVIGFKKLLKNNFLLVLLISALILSSCNKKLVSNATKFLIDSVLNNSNYTGKIKIYYRFDDLIEKSLLDDEFLKQKYNFNHNTIDEQIEKYKDQIINEYKYSPNENYYISNKYEINNDEILFIISPPFFSSDKKYIVFIIKYCFMFDNFKYWSYKGIVLKKQQNYFSFETEFINDHEIKNNFNDAEYAPMGGNLRLNH